MVEIVRDEMPTAIEGCWGSEVVMRWGGLPLFCFRHHRHGNGGYVSKVKMPNPVGSADRMRMTGTGMRALQGANPWWALKETT